MSSYQNVENTTAQLQYLDMKTSYTHEYQSSCLLMMYIHGAQERFSSKAPDLEASSCEFDPQHQSPMLNVNPSNNTSWVSNAHMHTKHV